MTADSDHPNGNDGSCCDQQQHIKRPMNPFMVWAQTRRKAIAAENPKLHNSDISRRLGEEWRTLPDKEKQPFRDEASRLKSAHRAAHPDYKYKPKCKKRPASQSDSGDDCDQKSATTKPDSEVDSKKVQLTEELATSTEQLQQPFPTPSLQAFEQPLEQPEIQLPPVQQPQQYIYQQMPSYSQVIYVDQNQLNYLLQQQQQQQQQQYFMSAPFVPDQTPAQYSEQQQQQQQQQAAFYGQNYQPDSSNMNGCSLASNFAYHQQQQLQQQQPPAGLFYQQAAGGGAATAVGTAAADGALMLSQL